MKTTLETIAKRRAEIYAELETIDKDTDEAAILGGELDELSAHEDALLSQPQTKSADQYTPGPWKFVDQGKIEEGERLLCIRSESSNGYIAQVQILGEHRKQAEANARLIASAPELKKESEELLKKLTSTEAAYQRRCKEVQFERDQKRKSEDLNAELLEACILAMHDFNNEGAELNNDTVVALKSAIQKATNGK